MRGCYERRHERQKRRAEAPGKREACTNLVVPFGSGASGKEARNEFHCLVVENEGPSRTPDDIGSSGKGFTEASSICLPMDSCTSDSISLSGLRFSPHSLPCTFQETPTPDCICFPQQVAF
jgi:hypothetical protein